MRYLALGLPNWYSDWYMGDWYRKLRSELAVGLTT